MEETVEYSTPKKDRDSFLYRLRKNDIINWIDRLVDVIKYRDLLQKCDLFSTLHIESGIVRVDPAGRYLSHKLAPMIEAGFSFNELCTILRWEIVRFEAEYGKFSISDADIGKLLNAVYKYNRELSPKLDMTDKKKLIHLEQSAEVLYYLLSRSVLFKAEINGWCTLTFTHNSNSQKNYCTIFTEDEIQLMERVSRLVNKS